MLARKFVSYRLHMTGITQNKQKCLIFIVVPQGRKSVEKKEKEKININKNNKNTQQWY